MKTILLAMLVCCAPINKSILKQDPVKPSDIKTSSQIEMPIIEESKCLSALSQIERKYQIRSQKNEETFEIYPIQMFPFFCLSNMIQCKICPPKARVVYLRSRNISVKEYAEDKTLHLQVAILHKTKGKIPWARIYTLHFLMLNSNNIWQEEKRPVSVTTVLANQEKEIYKLQ
jgi:hypothetical protein